MVKQGLFREDLFYRINTIHLEIPPLRERGDDILLFIDTFLRRFTSKYQRPDIRMHEQTIEKLRSYHWPGNIRELQHSIEKAIILCEGNVIRPKDIFVKQTWSPQLSTVVPNLEEVERQAIETAIRQNWASAARHSTIKLNDSNSDIVCSSAVISISSSSVMSF